METLMAMATDAELRRWWERPLFWQRMGERWLRVDSARPKEDASQFVSHVCAELGMRRTPVREVAHV
jgi:hypothetical protein